MGVGNPPGGDDAPVSFSRRDAGRVRDATVYFEREVRGGRPRPRDRARGNLNPGIYAYVAGNISGASGNELGGGTAVLCSRVVKTLTPDGETVGFLNAGGPVAGPVYVKLGWADGEWSLDVVVCPAS